MQQPNLGKGVFVYRDISKEVLTKDYVRIFSSGKRISMLLIPNQQQHPLLFITTCNVARILKSLYF